MDDRGLINRAAAVNNRNCVSKTRNCVLEMMNFAGYGDVRDAGKNAKDLSIAGMYIQLTDICADAVG